MGTGDPRTLLWFKSLYRRVQWFLHIKILRSKIHQNPKFRTKKTGTSYNKYQLDLPTCQLEKLVMNHQIIPQIYIPKWPVLATKFPQNMPSSFLAPWQIFQVRIFNNPKQPPVAGGNAPARPMPPRQCTTNFPPARNNSRALAPSPRCSQQPGWGCGQPSAKQTQPK